MENQELLDNNLYASNGLSFNSAATEFLGQTAKWAKFLSIVGFVFSGLMIIIGLFFGTLMGKINPLAAQGMGAAYSAGYSIGMTIYFIVLALIMVYPCLRLYQFAQQARIAIASSDSNALEMSMKRIRSVFRFYGILTIIVLSIYILAILFALIAGGSALGSM